MGVRKQARSEIDDVLLISLRTIGLAYQTLKTSSKQLYNLQPVGVK